MLKKLKNLFRTLFPKDEERFSVPRSVQQTIPIHAVSKDGIFYLGQNRYSKSWAFSDINYAVAAEEEREEMIEQYGRFINTFELGETSKITLLARKASRFEYESRILLPLQQDGLDEYRKELNDMLLKKAGSEDNLVLERYLTVTIERPSVEEARAAFQRIGSTLSIECTRLGSKLSDTDTEERLALLCRFYHAGTEVEYQFNPETLGADFKDTIAPDGMEFHSNYFRMGERYGRALFFRDWTTRFSENIITGLATINRNLCISIDLKPIPTHLAMKEIDKRMMAVEGEINNWQRKQNQHQNFSADTPYHMKLKRQEVNETYVDINERDQRMMVGTVTLVHTADSLEELDRDTEALIQKGQNNLVLSPLRYQQQEGLNTALPIGLNQVHITRTLTTETAAFHVPFRVQEIMDRGGMYFGENAISRNLILCDKARLLNPNMFLLGVPGSGKSFAVKMQLAYTALLHPEDDIIICDPEGEFSDLVNALGGEVINISASSPHHINAMEMVEGYSDGNSPSREKADFILTLFELIDKEQGVGGREHSIIDRCVREVYEDMKQTGEVATLCTLREKLMEQSEPEAHDLALTLELFTEGSLNVFAHLTNVNTKNRITSYNIYDLGEQLKSLGLLVVTDAMINRVADNDRKRKRTHIIIDEAHVVFENEHSGAFFESAWRRFRKRNAYPTAITQNADYLLNSVSGSTMLSNSELIVMLSQAPKDQQRLGELLGISKEQMEYVNNAKQGCGLIRYGGILAPFVNDFPKNTQLYRLMNTKPERDKHGKV